MCVYIYDNGSVKVKFIHQKKMFQNYDKRDF